MVKLKENLERSEHIPDDFLRVQIISEFKVEVWGIISGGVVECKRVAG